MALDKSENVDKSEKVEVPHTTREEIASLAKAVTTHDDQARSFLLRVVQPGLAGLMDGSVSTLAPIFATAFVTHVPFTTFLVGIASAMGAGISMAFSEALSDDGSITGRGSPVIRGLITGAMTFFGGILHTLPFLIPDINAALYAAYIVVAFELVLIAAIRHRYFGTSWLLSIVQVVGGGALVFAAAFLFGHA
jgi:erythrin-vacuolar iron transport family protein